MATNQSAVPAIGNGPLHPENTIPEIPAFDTGRNLVVWCAHCRCWHLHGRGDGGSDGNGHLRAHCHDPNSPYHKSGYFIRYAGPATPDMLEDLRMRRPRGPSLIAQTGEVRP